MRRKSNFKRATVVEAIERRMDLFAEYKSSAKDDKYTEAGKAVYETLKALREEVKSM